MSDLFARSTEAKRQALRNIGWRQCAGTLFGEQLWESPDGKLVRESQAMDSLPQVDGNDTESEGGDAD